MQYTDTLQTCAYQKTEQLDRSAIRAEMCFILPHYYGPLYPSALSSAAAVRHRKGWGSVACVSLITC